jgi:hypothetical protein
MKFRFLSLIALLVTGIAHAELRGNTADGKSFHDAHCLTCHNTQVYTRKDHHIQSLEALKQQLDSCGHMTKIELTIIDKQNLVKYLNEQFYHFP